MVFDEAEVTPVPCILRCSIGLRSVNSELSETRSDKLSSNSRAPHRVTHVRLYRFDGDLFALVSPRAHPDYAALHVVRVLGQIGDAKGVEVDGGDTEHGALVRD